MPTYEFICEKCESITELFQGICQPLPIECEKCGSTEPVFYQKFGCGAAGLAKGYSSVTTVGQIAELNSKRLGKEQLRKREEHEKAIRKPIGRKGVKGTRVEKSEELPWWRSGKVAGLPKMDKPLDLSKIPDKERYIHEGH